MRGFTLWELLVAMLVIGLVLGLGVPNFLAFNRNNAMTAAVNGLVSALHVARTEAVKRQLPVTVCLSSDPLVGAPNCDGGGNGGFVAFTENDVDAMGNPDPDGVFDMGEAILVQRADPGGTIDVTFDDVSVTYDTNGFIVDDGVLPMIGTALFCDERGNQDAGNGESVARAVLVSPTGRPQLRRDMASIATAVADTGGACP